MPSFWLHIRQSNTFYMKNLIHAVVEPAVKLFVAFLTATWLGFLFGFAPLCAQDIRVYGAASAGGDGRGTIFGMNLDGSALDTFVFPFAEGYTLASGPLLKASNGKLYGCSSFRDNLYEYDPLTDEYRVLHKFDWGGGNDPDGGLVEYNGKFYGVTLFGGNFSQGVLFEYNPVSGAYAVLHHFNDPTAYGRFTKSRITVVNGKFYGTVNFSGIERRSMLYEYNPAGTGTYTVLHNFGSVANDGVDPTGGLLALNGKLYGTTVYGGTGGGGVLYEYNISANTYNLLVHFGGNNGSLPGGGVIASNGALYGLAVGGGNAGAGVLYKYDLGSGGAFSVLRHFDFPNGANPGGELLLSGGKFYGGTQGGGSDSLGVLFEYNPAGAGTYTVLHHFYKGGGRFFNGTLIESSGKFYGAMTAGELGNPIQPGGVLFEYSFSNGYQVMLEFERPRLGAYPFSKMLQSGSELYGTTILGGENGVGVLYKYAPNTQTYKVLHHFSMSKGFSPYGDLIWHGGKIYGTTLQAGRDEGGTLFQFDTANGGVHSVLHTFDVSRDGEILFDGVTAYNGKLYGTAAIGGSHRQGTIYQYDLANGSFTVAHHFDSINGKYPQGGLCLLNGKFYGMTVFGGNAGKGVLYEYDPANGGVYRVLRHFSSSDGENPYGRLTAYEGKLYGLMTNGGNTGFGLLFQYTPSSGAYEILLEFNASRGQYPCRSLTLFGGKLYGTTLAKDNGPDGVVFEYDPANGTYSIVRQLDGSSGFSSFGGVTIIDPCVPPAFTTCTNTAITVSTEAGRCNAVVQYTAIAEGSPAPMLTYTLTGATTGSGNGTGSGTTFGKGNTTVTITAANRCGSATCSFIVEVLDREKPQINCPGNKVLKTSDDGGADCTVVLNYAPPTYSDNCDGMGVATLLSGPSSGFALTVRPTPYTIVFTYTDVGGNSATCSFKITVVDDTPPQINCPGNQTVSSGASSCSSAPFSYIVTATDNCTATTTLQSGLPSNSTFPLGSNIVAWTTMDAGGNSATCSFTVTVVDNVAPRITCPENQTVSSSASSCASMPSSYMVTVTDNCTTTTTLLNGLPSGSAFPLGSNTVSWITTDAGGNSATCSFTVTVVDNTPPSITCPADFARNTDADQCTAVVAYSNPVVSENCTGWSLMQTGGQPSGSALPIGANLVVWKVTDVGGNSATCSFTITVTDAQAPTVSCPANLLRSNDPNQCGATVAYAQPTATDNCGAAATEHISGGISGGMFPLGTTIVTWKATDGRNLTATCTFTITIMDSQTPNITCPANIARSTDPGQCTATVMYANPAYSDNCPGAGLDHLSGGTSGSAFPKGTTTVVWMATDVANNTRTCSFRIIVTDTQVPTFTNCPSGQTVSAATGQCSANVTYATPTAVDNCAPLPTVTRIGGPTSGATFNIGNTTVIWRAIDGAGRSSTCSFVIMVVDNQAPTVTCPQNMVQNNPANACNSPVFYNSPTASDNCGVNATFLVSGIANGSIFPIGTTTVTWQANDVNGLTATCSFTVTVNCGTLRPNPVEERDAAETANGFKLIPNPASDAVLIAWDMAETIPAYVAIFDAQGRLVWEKPTKDDLKTLQVNVSDWPAGIYLVALWSKVQTVTKRLVVGH